MIHAFKKNEGYNNEYDMPKIEPIVNAIQFSDLIRHSEHIIIHGKIASEFPKITMKFFFSSDLYKKCYATRTTITNY